MGCGQARRLPTSSLPPLSTAKVLTKTNWPAALYVPFWGSVSIVLSAMITRLTVGSSRTLKVSLPFYGQARVTPGGVIDRPMEQGEPTVYRVIDPGEEEGRVVEPRVPFNEEWSDR